MKDFESTTPTLSSWWTRYEDPTLNSLITLTAAGNIDLKIAVERINEARHRLGISKGERLPQVNGTAAALTTRTSEATLPFLPDGIDRESSLYQLGGSVGWELDLWGRVRRSIESADAAYAGTGESYRDLLVILYAEVATTYIDTRSLQERIRLSTRNAKLQGDMLKLSIDRNKAGLVPELDVRQAELILAITKSSIPSLRVQLARSINRLSVLTGQAPSALHDTLSGAGKIPIPSGTIAVGLPTDLLRQRPDIRQAERTLASQHARIGVTKAGLYPSFTLPGTLALEAPNTSDLLESGSLTYRFGPSVRWNLFDGKRTRNAIKVEESRTEQSRLAYEKTVLTALEEVENAMVSLAEERIRNENLTAAVTAAELSTKQVGDLYRAGLTDFQNVLDMQRSLTSQQDTLATSNGTLSKNYAQLYKALGGGWKPEPTEPGEEDQP